MLKMRPYAPPDRIAIRDSIDEEISDDIEDDVFIRDGRSGKSSEEKGLKRPLMAPRRKNSKTMNPIPIMKKHRRCWKCCEPFCYGLAAVTILIALIFLAALLLTLFPIPLQKIKIWLRRESNFPGDQIGSFEIIDSNFVPCTQISVQQIWTKAFPRMNSESPVRKVDLNGDKIEDIIFGYGIDDSILYEDFPLPKCLSAKQDEQLPCEGGVIALNGLTGEILWQRWSIAYVFSLFCTIDVDQDGFMDCIAAGRNGLIFAVNGRTGNVIWNFRELDVETNSPIVIDLYTISLTRDLDGDEISDILAVHVEERETSRAGHIKLISGKTGKVIRSIPTPFREDVFVPLQILTKEDGTELLLIITGGQNTPGGIFSIRLHSLMQYTSEKEFTPLFQTEFSGFMVPAILSDVTGDSIEDIIVSSFNSTVYAFNGRNSSMIWSYTFPASESVSSIVPGHFNHDNITDFMVKYNTGPGFPVYYYSQTTILNGINGQPLLSTMMTDSGGPNSLLGGISISQTFGGDFFFHWQTQCRGKYDVKDAYQFIPDSDIIQQARADTCLLRYNTSTILKLYAITRHVEPPGAVIFTSDDLNLHLNKTENRQLLQQNSVSPIKHPKMLKKLMAKDSFPAVQKPPATPHIIENIVENKIKELPIPRENFRKTIVNIPEQQDSERNQYEQMKPFFYMPFSNQPGREFKDYEIDQKNPEDYDVLYNDEQQNDRPIHLRTKYPSNRDVRSGFVGDYDIILNDTKIDVTKVPAEQKIEEPINLWDLEMEKEEEEAIKEARKDDYSSKRARDTDSSDPTENFLPSISSTGVLLGSIPSKTDTVLLASSIDFAFILNVRESEQYPPLFLPQDGDCIKDKMSGYGSYSPDDLLALEKQFLKQCLKARISNMSPNIPRYESQLIVTRLSISCDCGKLEKGEICSRIETIDKQRWTEFMGNHGNGLYRN